MDLVLQKKRMKKKARKQARKNESLNEQPRRCFTQVREEQRSKERMMGTEVEPARERLRGWEGLDLQDDS